MHMRSFFCSVPINAKMCYQSCHLIVAFDIKWPNAWKLLKKQGSGGALQLRPPKLQSTEKAAYVTAVHWLILLLYLSTTVRKSAAGIHKRGHDAGLQLYFQHMARQLAWYGWLNGSFNANSEPTFTDGVHLDK